MIVPPPLGGDGGFEGFEYFEQGSGDAITVDILRECCAVAVLLVGIAPPSPPVAGVFNIWSRIS